MKTSTLQTAQSAFNIATDAFIFIMPLPLIYRMTMPLHDKRKFPSPLYSCLLTSPVIVILVLALGTVAIIASTLRIYFIYPGLVRNSFIKWYVQADRSLAADMTWNAVNPGEWTLIEANLMIICASIFALRRLWVSHKRKSGPPPPGSISGRQTLPSPGRTKPAFLSPSHIL